jgi:hypothetical protein
MNEIALPVGTLMSSPDGPLVVRLRPGPAGRKAAEGWLQRLGTRTVRGLLVPRRISERPSGLEVEYPEESRKTLPLSARLAEWIALPRAAVPEILSLGRFVLTAGEALAGMGEVGTPVGPAVVRLQPGPPVSWHLVPIPTRGTTLADWARADSGIWLWSTLPALVSGRGCGPVHALGAALHHALVGSVFPDSLPRCKWFSRVLRRWVGQPARLLAACRLALPASCAEDAELLARLVLDCLDSRPGRCPSAEQARQRLDEFELRLSVERLTKAWEAEYHPDIAQRLRQQAQPATPPEPKEQDEPAPATRSWGDLARQRALRGELAEALEAAWQAIVTDGPVNCRLYLWLVQRLACREGASRADVAAALSRLTAAFAAQFDEGDHVRVAHLKARYLQAGPAELGLPGTYESRWNEGMSLVVRAWLESRKGGAFAQLSKLCKEGGKLFAAMPSGGGEASKYARAYLSLLDGYAHMVYVAQFGKADYHLDALACFTRCFELATEVGAADLLRANARFLACLAERSRQGTAGPVRSVHLGALAMLQAQGVPAEGGAGPLPDVPAYDDERLFPL